jgi:hypothetical protein
MVENIVNNQGGSHIYALSAWNRHIGSSHGNLRPFVPQRQRAANSPGNLRPFVPQRQRHVEPAT